MFKKSTVLDEMHLWMTPKALPQVGDSIVFPMQLFTSEFNILDV